MTVSELVVVLDDAGRSESIEVGVLRREGRGAIEVIRFAYSARWLEEVRDAFAIDPELPLYPGDQFPGKPRELFGIFRDASPERST